MRLDPLAYLSTELDTLKQQGLYRHLRVLQDGQKPTTTVDHQQVVNLSSNNYLGLTTHPRLRERALEAITRLGVGTGSVRSIRPPSAALTCSRPIPSSAASPCTIRKGSTGITLCK